jgi:hypothetical protein
LEWNEGFVREVITGEVIGELSLTRWIYIIEIEVKVLCLQLNAGTP